MKIKCVTHGKYLEYLAHRPSMLPIVITTSSFCQDLILHHKVTVSFLLHTSSKLLLQNPTPSCLHDFSLRVLSSPQCKNLLLGTSNLFLVVLQSLNISLMLLLPATCSTEFYYISSLNTYWIPNYTI